jgi:predicted DNA-binding transcriptional regulator AlpA
MKELATVAADPTRIPSLSADRIPELIGECEQLRARLLAQLFASARPPVPDVRQAAPDRLLDVNQAAERLGVDRRWIYSRADMLPFTRRLGARKLRFSESGIQKYIENRRP